MKNMSLGLKDALRLTLKNIRPLLPENIPLAESVDRIAASDLYALVDSPSMDSSRKDGYAVLSHEVANTTPENPVQLQLLGSMAAGGKQNIPIRLGTTVRVLTGARIPIGADAVVAEEFTIKKNNKIYIQAPAEPKNILRRGSDVTWGKRILRKGQKISPIMIGLLAVAGHSMISVFRNPIAGIIGTGDELVKPGKTLSQGKLYASNIITLAGWCNKYKIKSRMAIVKDNHGTMFNTLQTLSRKTDVIITSGGAWTGDHDIIAEVLEELGWKKVFHRIRIGPGKAVGFGTLNNKPVFILPGGPPSNLIGFLQIALPGLLALAGYSDPGLSTTKAKLASDLKDGKPDWTDFFFGILKSGDELPVFHPLNKRSRLSSITDATAIASIPEGQDFLVEGSVISVQLLT